VNDGQRAAPVDEAELSTLLGGADRAGRTVRITGGNTLAGMGARPAVDLEILTTTIAGVVDFEPDDLTVAVLAGTRLSELATTLAERRQMLPFDAPLPKQATVGGTLAAGWRGPRRHVYGPPRDWVIGSHAVLADGTVARAGGMVVKNVAGYDLSRLYVGSFGTLSVLVRANLKTLPVPERTRAFFAALPDGSLERTIGQLRDLRVVPAAAFWFDGFSSFSWRAAALWSTAPAWSYARRSAEVAFPRPTYSTTVLRQRWKASSMLTYLLSDNVRSPIASSRCPARRSPLPKRPPNARAVSNCVTSGSST
jgi:FAD/FMN-containing dehydrogenase